MAARIGAIFYWLGVASTAFLFFINVIDKMFGGFDLGRGFLAFLIGTVGAFIPFLIAWGIRWILTGRSDFSP